MPAEPTGPVAFQPTRWSVVTRASERAAPEARAALDDLVRAYWRPLYAFLRRRGTAPEEAADLVQGFFCRALEKDWIGQADPTRGRFRTFLLAALQHFAANEAARERAAKRGGGRTPVTLDVEAEERGLLEGRGAGVTPERAFERRYAEEVLVRALARLAEAERGGSADKAERFEVLAPLLWQDVPPHREPAARLGISETALRVALHRLRGRLRDAIRAEVAETVTDPTEIDDELRHLVAALRGG